VLNRGSAGTTRSYALDDAESAKPVIETSGWGLGGDDGGVSAPLPEEEVSGAEIAKVEQPFLLWAGSCVLSLCFLCVVL